MDFLIAIVAIILYFCHVSLGQSSNLTLITGITDVVLNSTYPQKNSVQTNVLTLCPFISKYGPSDAPSITLTGNQIDPKIGCIISSINGDPVCINLGEKNSLATFCDIRNYRINVNINFIWNSVVNGTIPAISTREISLLVESQNHGPVSVTFRLVIDTTTGMIFPLMGSFGGSFKKTICNEGHYVNKIMGNHDNGDYFRGLYIFCTDGTERIASELNYLTTKKNLIDCSSNLAVTGLYVDVEWNMVWGMRYICADKTATSWIGGVDKSYSVYQMCPKGTAVNGLFVQSGAVIDGMALSCQEVPFSISYVKADEDESSPETPFTLNLDETQPYIYLNSSIIQGSIGSGGPQAMLLKTFIDYGGVANGSFEIYSTIRKGWIPIRNTPLTLREVISDQVRLRLFSIEASVIPIQLYLNASSAFGHLVSLAPKKFIINIKWYSDPAATTLITRNDGLNLSASGLSMAMVVPVAIAGIVLLSGALVFVIKRRQESMLTRKLNNLRESPNPHSYSANQGIQSFYHGTNIADTQTLEFPERTNMSKKSDFTGADFTKPQAGKSTIDNQEFTKNNTVTMTSSSSKSLAVPGYLKLDFNRDFEVQDKIGAGGNATVFRAKVISPKLITKHGEVSAAIKIVTDTDLNVFMFEIAILGSLPPSQNIVRFLGYFESPNGMAMKMYDGTLKDILFNPDIPLHISTIKQMARDIATGCKEIHAFGLIHFDIKPHNILIDGQEFRCAISDFGCAKPIGSEFSNRMVKGLQMPETMGLTIPYSSPELIRMMRLRQNLSCTDEHKKIDVYAFGITLYEMITRSRAWPPLQPDQLSESILRGDRPLFPDNLLKMAHEDKMLETLIDVASQSWNVYPGTRPTFEHILGSLASIE